MLLCMSTMLYSPPCPIRCLKGDDGLPHEGSSNPDQTTEPTEHSGRRALVCKMCRAHITRPDLAMRVDGQHRHVFFNPHGYVFEIGCFASAKNVAASGPKTDEFTWFPGYTWQAVGCAHCATLLGWRYTGKDGGFYGFILKMLVEEEGTRP